MKINPNLSSFDISAKGMSIQKKKMDLIAENISNSSTTKTKDGIPYKKKFLVVENNESLFNKKLQLNSIKLRTSEANHIATPEVPFVNGVNKNGINAEVSIDESKGEMVYMPEHPDANEEGYVEMPNVNVINEMVDMIAATRSFEANLTAFNSSKQIAKDSMEI